VKDSNMTDSSRPATIEQRIANAQAVRAAVDSQGRPISKPSTFTYDDHGRLIKAEPAGDA
jgi:hypothetical protein